jgi:hypothetical protein
MKQLSLLAVAVLFAGCATYHTADKVKLVSFTDTPSKGKSIGNIRGEDCTWTVLGYQLGGLPTVDRAFTNARRGIDGGLAAAGFSKESGADSGLSYVNNVSTRNDGFSIAGIVAKSCIVVSGVGYK